MKQELQQIADHLERINRDLHSEPNPQRTPRKGIFCHPRAVFAIRTYNFTIRTLKTAQIAPKCHFWQ